MTGTVKGYQIGKNRDSSQDVLLLQCAISADDDIQLVEYMNAPGDNTIPPIGSIVTILSAGRSWKIAIACNDTKDFDSGLSEGDKYLYSKSEASYVRILSDGNIELNGNSDNAVRYADLNTALQSYVEAVNAALATKLDGSGSSGTLSLDISGSKVNEVKLP